MHRLTLFLSNHVYYLYVYFFPFLNHTDHLYIYFLLIVLFCRLALHNLDHTSSFASHGIDAGVQMRPGNVACWNSIGNVFQQINMGRKNAAIQLYNACQESADDRRRKRGPYPVGPAILIGSRIGWITIINRERWEGRRTIDSNHRIHIYRMGFAVRGRGRWLLRRLGRDSIRDFSTIGRNPLYARIAAI